MREKLNRFYLFLIFTIIITAISAVFAIRYYKNTKEMVYLKENISTLDIAYRSSLNKYSLFTKYILDHSIGTDSVTALFKKGQNAKAQERDLYKGLLYRKLYPLYLNLQKEGIRQLHFHLKNNNSYIRFHKPSRYGDSLTTTRDTIRVANEQNRAVTRFETGKVVSGFRNVFPLSHRGEHIGSVEISISTKMIVDSIEQIDNRREYSFIFNKSVVFPKLFESQKYLYQLSDINSNYVIEDKNSNLPDSPKPLSNIANKINKQLKLNDTVKQNLMEQKQFGVFVTINDLFYDVTFIPLLGISNKLEGYLVSYKKSENLPVIMTMENYLYAIVFAGMSILITMILLLRHQMIFVQKQQKWFESMTNNLLEGLFVTDEKHIINYINPAACKTLGYDSKELIGQNANKLFGNSSSQHKVFNRMKKQSTYTSDKEIFRTQSGSNINVSLKSNFIKTNNKSQIITSFRDITLQKKLEEKSTLLMQALESSINCVVITDKNAIVQWANPAFKNLTGYEINEIIGKDPKEFISSGKQSKEFYKKMWQTILNKKPWKGELINRRKEGTLYTEELIITPVLDEKKHIVNFIAVKEDITHKKRLAVEKEEQDKLFFQQSKLAAMGEMLGNIAHQWRQPLSAISTAATGTKFQKELNILSDQDLCQAMDSINSSAQFLSQTIEDFRDFFNPRSSKPDEFNINDTIKRTLSLIQANIVSNNIEVINTSSSISIFSLENELLQVILNILNNSVDILKTINDKERLIFIDSRIHNDTLILSIKDNGGGIKTSVIDKVFEPYFTTKHQSQGTGIGLYMSEQIITKHIKGSLYVKNTSYTHNNHDYRGACFYIAIPLV